MNVLVLGGTGYIGRALVASLAADPALAVWSASRSATSASLLGVRAEPLHIDLANADAVERLPAWLNTHGVEVVIHAAGPPGDAKCREDMWRAYAAHVGVVQTLVAEWPKGRLVYLSTLLDPAQGVYAELKRMAETYVRRNPRNVIFRLGSVYGGGSNEGVVSRFIRAALRAERVSIYGDGTQTIPLVHIDDVVELVRCAISGALPPRGPVQVYREDAAVPVSELYVWIARAAGCYLEPEFREGPVRPYVIDPALPIAWPRVGLDEGLLRAVRLAAEEETVTR